MKNKQANARLCLKIFFLHLVCPCIDLDDLSLSVCCLGLISIFKKLGWKLLSFFLASMYFVQLLVFFLLGQQDEAVNDRQHSLSKAHLGMSMLALEIKLYILE